VSIEKQLAGTGRLKDLLKSKNIPEGVNIRELVKLPWDEIVAKVKSGEVPKKVLSQIKKAFRGHGKGL
jgi:hypothetical protein